MEKNELEKRLIWYENRYGPYIEKRGFHNWKNLLKKPTRSQWLILGMLIILLGMSYVYMYETKACRDFVQNIETNSCTICSEFQNKQPINNPIINGDINMSFEFGKDT